MAVEFDLFDVKAYLAERRIKPSPGKNVSSGWIAITCPFCDDITNHLGISPSNGITCWRCGKHDLLELIQAIDNCSKAEAFRVLSDFQNPNRDVPLQKTYSGILDFPEKELDDSYYPEMLKYLQGRGFKEDIITQYHLRPFGRFGDYKFRIMIPVVQDGVMRTFTTRDYTERASIKTLHYDQVPIKNYLYNLDTVIKTCWICEGPADVWRLGPGAVATFGILYSREQILALVEKKPERVFIVFDAEPDATKQAEKLWRDLSLYFNNTGIVELPMGKDPGELSDEEAKEIKGL